MENAKPVIEVRDLEIKIGGKRLVGIDSLDIDRGDIVFLIGGNGCGKSTLLSMFGQNVRRDDRQRLSSPVFSGSLLLRAGGAEAELIGGNTNTAAFQKFYAGALSYLAQDDYFESHGGIDRAIKLPSLIAIDELYRRDRQKRKEKLAELDSETQRCKSMLSGAADATGAADGLCGECAAGGGAFGFGQTGRRASVLSGGQKRLLSFLGRYVRAKVIGSDVLVLDEPLNHLDHSYKSVVNSLLSELWNERLAAGAPVTYIIVSHCLLFSFIENNDKCKQYIFDGANRSFVPLEPKRHFDCLNVYKK